MRQISQHTILKMFYKTCVCLAVVFETRAAAQGVAVDSLQQQVRNAEMAFAQTMADRDFEAFKSFVSEEAIFLSDTTARRGRDQIAEHWKQYYQGDRAPFSWRPETVLVLSSGNLALSTGPVFDSSGKLTAYFTSTWRQEERGVWRVIFDKGCAAFIK